jgi:hypothetical protein
VSEAFAGVSDAVSAARNGVVDITVVPSAVDLRVAVRANPNRPYDALLTILARLGSGAIFAGLTAAFMWLMNSAEDTVVLVSTALAGGVVGIAAFRFAIEHQWKIRLLRDAVARRDPYRVVGDGRSLSIEDEHTFVRVNLSGLRHVVETTRHLIVFHRHAPVLALPRAAFPRPEIATAFANFLRSRIDSADGHTPETRIEIRHE